jgi:hypothetical protein
MLSPVQKRHVLLAAVQYKDAELCSQSWAPAVSPVLNRLGDAYDWAKNTAGPPVTGLYNLGKSVSDAAVPLAATATGLTGLYALLSNSYNRGGSKGILDTILHGDKANKLPSNTMVPAALGAGAGALLPPERELGEPSAEYRRRKRNRMILGALIGGGGGLGYHFLSNAKK